MAAVDQETAPIVMRETEGIRGTSLLHGTKYTVSQKNANIHSFITSTDVGQFSIYDTFTVLFSFKFSAKSMPYFLPYLKCVAALPSKI